MGAAINHRILVFTVHKAASLGVHDVMHKVARKEGWPLHSPNLKKPNLTEPEAPGDAAFFDQLAGKTGLVGPIRMPVDLSAMTEGDVAILHLRDPRDVLVSMFFSWGFSHPGVNEDYRKDVQDKGVDAFAINNSAGLKEKYDLYLRDYLGRPGVALLRYEDFVLDKPVWMRAFLAAAGLDPEKKHYVRLANKNPAAKVREEDLNAHIRKALPGDYLDKLAPETIARLNEEWRDVLEALGY